MVKPFWIKNYTGNDVGLSDLAMKVPAHRTIDIFKYKPTLTEDEVKRSKESGSLSKRLEAGILGIVKGKTPERPHTLDHIKESREIVKIVKTKGGVLIDTEEEDVLSDSDFGEFADYGLGDLGHENTEFDASQKGAVVVMQKQDPDEDEQPVPKVVAQNIGANKKSVAIMIEQAEASVNPIGPLADVLATESFVVVKPPADEPEKVAAPAKSVTKVKKIGDRVVVEPEQSAGVEFENNTIDFDAKVATKDESGAIVMQVKEVAPETDPAAEVKKGTPIKTKAKKKTSKKK